MKKIAFLFSGQGSQYVGMGRELAEKFPRTEKIFETGSDILGFDLRKTIFTDDGNELTKTKFSQPAIYAVSLIALECLKETLEIGFCAVAGHSLGEYAAMTAAGMLDVENGFKAVKIRSEAMNDAAEKHKGGMIAALGTSACVIEEACLAVRDGGDYVSPVNYNSPAQTVIAGTEAGLEKAASLLTEKGVRRIVKLNVAAAFHSELMNEAAEKFKAAADFLTFCKPSVDFYSNVYGKKLDDFSDNAMLDYLSRHICSPVRFTGELTAMYDDGIETFIEFGPGKTLCGFVKKTLSSENIKAANVEDLKSLETAKNLF